MRDETQKEPEVLDVSVEAGALLASGLTVDFAKHEDKVCASCSQFNLHFLTDNKSSFRFSMHGREFIAYFRALEAAVEKLAQAVGDEEEKPHA
jgi:hypothetical protein